MSGNEIRALEDQIKALKVQNSQKEKRIASLEVTQKGLQDQIAAQTIENFSTLQQKDDVRLQLDQVNCILDRLGFKDQVYDVLHQDQQQAQETPTIYGMGPTLVEEYQMKLAEMKSELDSINMMVKSL